MIVTVGLQIFIIFERFYGNYLLVCLSRRLCELGILFVFFVCLCVCLFVSMITKLLHHGYLI